MDLILYNNLSETNKLNKTIVKIIKLEGVLREPSSLINPSIIIELNPNNFKSYVVDDNKRLVVFNGTKITWESFIYDYIISANYVYIPDFNRYYFIEDIVSIRNNLWRINMHVDVLMSYKNAILNTSAFISRNENIYNDDIVDELRDFEYPKSVEYVDIENETTVDTLGDNYEYLVAVSADDAAKQLAVPIMQPNNIGNSLNIRINDSYLGFDRNILFYSNDVYSLFKAIYESDTLRSYIKYLKVLPFTFEKTFYSDREGDQQTYPDKWSKNFHIGSRGDIYTTSTCTMPKYNVIVKKIADFILDNFIDYIDDYRKAEPYTIIEIFIPFYNYVKLNYVEVHNHHLQVYFLTTIGDGNTTGVIYDATMDKIIWSSKVECSTDVPFSTTNSYENEKRKDGIIMSTAIGTLSSVVSTALGVVSGNPVMAAGGVIGGVSTITKAISSASQIFDTASVGTSSSTSGRYNSMKCFIKITKQNRIDVISDEEYCKLYGKPLKQIYKLSDLTGFTIIEEEHLEQFGTALKTEHDEIKTLLHSGIIL